MHIFVSIVMNIVLSIVLTAFVIDMFKHIALSLLQLNIVILRYQSILSHGWIHSPMQVRTAEDITIDSTLLVGGSLWLWYTWCVQHTWIPFQYHYAFSLEHAQNGVNASPILGANLIEQDCFLAGEILCLLQCHHSSIWWHIHLVSKEDDELVLQVEDVFDGWIQSFRNIPKRSHAWEIVE